MLTNRGQRQLNSKCSFKKIAIRMQMLPVTDTTIKKHFPRRFIPTFHIEAQIDSNLSIHAMGWYSNRRSWECAP